MSSILTQGIRYTGSKREIIPKILSQIQTHCSGVHSILDACAGTTRVSQAFKQSGFSVTANDLSSYSKVFAQCYLMNTQPKSDFEKWIAHLNSLPPKNGWFSENYGGVVTEHAQGNAIQADGQKRPWQLHNTQKLDAILDEIPKLTKNELQRAVLLTSTILAMDKVDNTMGHQVAYLKKWPTRSYQSIHLEVPQLIPEGTPCFASQQSILDIKDPFDLVYIDPPYGTNNQKTKTTRVRYKSYYHLWTTICENDQPTLHGAAQRRYDASSDSLPDGISVFESTNHQEVFDVTQKMIADLNCRYVMFSYANKAKLSEADLREIFSAYKILEFASFDYKEHAMKSATTNNEWMGDSKQNQEFLILVEKS